MPTDAPEIAEEPVQNEIENQNENERIEELIVREAEEEEKLPVPVKEENAQISVVEPDNKTDEFVEKENEEATLNNEIVEVPVVEESEEKLPEEINIPEPQLQESESSSTIEDEEATVANGENKAEEVAEEIEPTESASADETEDEETEDLAVPFEPLHTVDYFASQGIKLSEEALNNDQLGKQVKSFTAWLKSMKKLHPGQLPEQNEVIEKLIQTSSEASNQNANVLTEAMAEVLVKQGKREKAIEMYQKLSLINPSKSAYFAAKIENLKII